MALVLHLRMRAHENEQKHSTLPHIYTPLPLPHSQACTPFLLRPPSHVSNALIERQSIQSIENNPMRYLMVFSFTKAN